MASTEETTLHRCEPALPTGHIGFRGQSVFEKGEGSAWLDDPPNLADRGLDIRNRAEGHGTQHVIDGVRFEVESGSIEADEVDRDSPGSDSRLGQSTGDTGGIDGEHLGDRIGKVGNIESGAESDFENRSAEASARFPSKF